MTGLPLPPGVTAESRVVLFDGVCKLCSAWARFLIRFDTRRRFTLATVQSPEGKAVLTWCGLPTDTYETLVLVSRGRAYVRSAAVIRILSGLPMPWPLAWVVWLIPAPIRDWAYDRVALNRYRLFGKHNHCVVPTPDHLRRFLNASSLPPR